MGSIITGTGMAVPPDVVTNDDLAKVMDTSDEWIRTRSGVGRRHVAKAGVGSTDLATTAGLAALDDAGVDPIQVDALISATMTPDHYAPGNAPIIQRKMGLGHVAAYEIRQQCSGFVYGLDLADSLLATEKADTVLVVGAEVHAGYMPFDRGAWDIVLGRSDATPTDAQRARATEARGWAVLFGDGAGAFVIQRSADPDVGMLASTLHTNGEHFDLIHVPGLGFVHQPFVDQVQLEAGLHVPTMNGRELFRQAVHLMPDAVSSVAKAAGVAVSDLDLVIAHQANDRILAGVRKGAGLTAEQVPSNIGRYGNTTAATLPILYHEQRSSIAPGALVAFTAFGAGAHWGAVLYREP